jgi:hypothetical protein
MMVELGWRVGFNFEGKLAWGCVGEVHPNLMIKIQIRGKI